MIWLVQNWRLALLMIVAFVFGVMGVRARWLSDRLDKARAKADELQNEVEAHETRNEVENRIASERDPRERLRRDWRE